MKIQKSALGEGYFMKCILSGMGLIAVLASGLLLAGCGFQSAHGADNGSLEVGVVKVRPERVVLIRELPGRTAAFRVADIRPQVNGLIIKRAFEEGALVKAGELLYEIDPAPYQAAYDQAKAAVAIAEANLPAVRLQEKRFKELIASNAVGLQEYDNALAALRQAEAQLEASKAALETAKINLSYTPIKSPISGRIGRSNVTEGAMVTAYQPVALATIQQLDPIYVDVPQSTAELLKLQARLADGKFTAGQEGQDKVAVRREDGTLYPLEGTLQFRDVTVSPTTGSVILRILVPNPDNTLLPGMFVRAVIKEGVFERGILIPQAAVCRDQKGEPFVWVIGKDGKAAISMLTLDRALGDKWLISSGLADGDQVIIDGLQRLRPGIAVAAAGSHPQGAKNAKPAAKTD
ncbi:MAG: efflux RND transporter periplasmic adaptor subunit [Candidatus Omnitrophica bacterium]|nr:efflux RND transporter periplasmic adaptor subunit [Candidatus Omnitrophota bacterium]